MAKKNVAKRNFIASILATTVSASMLVGSTFAWFTDSASSSNNVIKTGTLDLGMYWTETFGGAWTNAEGDNAPAIYGNEKWEPGYTDVKYVKIANEGSLSFKYEMNVLPNGEVGALAEVIDVYLMQDVASAVTKKDVADATPDGTFQDLIDGEITLAGTLQAGENCVSAIVLKMQETAGNEYQDESIGDSFELRVLATQYTYEEDSFGDDYDGGATFGTYIELNDGEDLLTAMASAKENMPLTIKLNSDVEWATEGHHGENDITRASVITIEGNGHTLTATGSGVTPLGDIEAPMILKNLTVVDNSVSYNEGAWELTYLEMGSPRLVCENVTFADEIQIGTNATFTNCSFESNEESVYAVWVEGGSAKFTNCTFTGYRGLKMHEAYGSEISSVIVKDCTFNKLTKKPGIAIGTLNADTTVSVKDSKFFGCQAGDQGLYIYETDTDVTTFNFINENNQVYGGSLTVTENTTTEELSDALANGYYVALDKDVEMEAETTAPYGNKYGVALNGGVLDGNGKELDIECYGDDYGIMTTGGTVKNLTIKNACRAIMIMNAEQDVILNNVNIGGDGVLYTINTGEEGSTPIKLIVTNSTLAGWTSFAANVESASFTNVTFEQGTYYNNIYGRVIKPYVSTTFTDCSFIEHMNLDLSALELGQKITMKNCTVNGQAVTASVFTIPTTDAEYDTELFTVDLPSWASSITDCIIFA